MLIINFLGSNLCTNLESFNVGQVSSDDAVPTFPPVDITSASDGMFGAIDFDSSWIGPTDNMDWVS
jgi:hypothetical protein